MKIKLRVYLFGKYISDYYGSYIFLKIGLKLGHCGTQYDTQEVQAFAGVSDLY